MSTGTKVLDAEISLLRSAPWNYKEPGTPEMLAKLAASIAHDKSAGVLAVREMPDGTLEVIDGNHRFEAVQSLGWTRVPVENFGLISQAEAIVVAQRRNFQWYHDDSTKLALLMKEVVLPEISLDELEAFMPQSRAALENLARMTDFNWDSMPDRQSDGLSFAMTPELKLLWDRWYSYATGQMAANSKSDALALALEVALGGPVASDDAPEPEEADDVPAGEAV
jgi:hypothetical protein